MQPLITVKSVVGERGSFDGGLFVNLGVNFYVQQKFRRNQITAGKEERLKKQMLAEIGRVGREEDEDAEK